MWDTIKQAFRSKKALATMVGIGLAIVRGFGLEVPAEALYLIATYVVGQGIADHGKSAAELRYAQPVDKLRALQEAD